MSIKYRPEIDGLRAIAVLSVIFYHAELQIGTLNILAGGFLGVDVFFVLSGYLITSIILKELKNTNQFSFKNFYERRARRILPAFFAVILSSFPIAWLTLLPKALTEYTNSLLSALGFSANFYFWQEDSYTAAPSALKPFLHTWSLSIEEQFYFIFPVILLLAHRKKLNTGWILIALFMTSIVLAITLTPHYPDSSFYLLHTRAWELVAGSLLAYREIHFGRPSYTRWTSLLSILGLILLSIPMQFLDDNITHPSFATLPTILGTCMVIWFSTPESPGSRWLSSFAMRRVGLLSYSFYLWHFPLFAFARIQFGSLTPTVSLNLIALSLILSELSYRWVETPFRKKEQIPMKTFLNGLIATTLITLSILIFFKSTKGAPFRFKEMMGVLSTGHPIELKQNGQSCHTRPLDDLCQFHPSETQKTAGIILNIGDSHANMLGSSLKKVALAKGFSFVHMSMSGCPFILQTQAVKNNKPLPGCLAKFQEQWRKKIATFQTPIIFYSGRFPLYFSGKRFNNQQGGQEMGPPYSLQSTTSESVQSHLQETLKWLENHSKALILVGPTPEAGWHIPNHIKNTLHLTAAKNWKNNFRQLNLFTDYQLFTQRSERTLHIFQKISQSPKVYLLRPDQQLCNSKNHQCQVITEKGLLYSDDNHLSPLGVEKAFPTLTELVHKL